MRLVLVRHGESAGNTEQVFRGPDSQTDGLTERGHAQARALGGHLRTLDLPGPRVYASVYRRAQETARALADALGGDVTVLGGVQEVDSGEWVGRSYRDLWGHWGEVMGEGGQPTFQGGESAAGVAARLWAAIEPLLGEDVTPVVVSHGFAIQAFVIAQVAGDPASAWKDARYAHRNASYTVLRRVGEGWEIEVLAAQGGEAG